MIWTADENLDIFFRLIKLIFMLFILAINFFSRNDLQEKCPEHVSINITDLSSEKDIVYKGGCLLTNKEDFKENAVNKSEYKESGYYNLSQDLV